jgi:hypothetical protein
MMSIPVHVSEENNLLVAFRLRCVEFVPFANEIMIDASTVGIQKR